MKAIVEGPDEENSGKAVIDKDDYNFRAANKHQNFFSQDFLLVAFSDRMKHSILSAYLLPFLAPNPMSSFSDWPAEYIYVVAGQGHITCFDLP